ncbi:hypothetical protein [Thalassobaculum sp.]|uniref:hypothetical protein n=1 Tax=Thalassobaculum sp. TaxID=2022740 RepID=UPI0032F04522
MTTSNVVPMKVADWPSIDHQLWARATVSASRLDEPGWASSWRPSTIVVAEQGYGSWLAWLDENEILDRSVRPAVRVAAERVDAFAKRLSGHVAGNTVSIAIAGLHRTLRAMEETTNFRWLDHLARHYANNAPSVRNKAARVIPSADLYQYGQELMDQAAKRVDAPVHGALQYRNGLIISFLAAHPIRRGNLSNLVLGQTIVRRGSRYRFSFEPSATKSRRVLEQTLIEDLTERFDVYLATVRPRLRDRAIGPDSRSLWIGMDGTTLDAGGLYAVIQLWTGRRYARALYPHLFRDCASTSVAIEDPEHIGIAKSVLGHTTLATSQKHYNMANGLSASRRFGASIAALKRRLANDDIDS